MADRRCKEAGGTGLDLPGMVAAAIGNQIAEVGGLSGRIRAFAAILSAG